MAAAPVGSVSSRSYQPDVIFVGGGPVALWTAVQAKIQNPALKILIFERYETYTRDNVLNIDVRSLAGAPKDPRLEAIIAKWRGCCTSKTIKIPTLDIQKDLQKLARELGIEIQNRMIEDAKGLVEEFPTVRCVVGSDGSHSVVQKQFFDSKMWFDQVLNYTVIFKYRAKDDPRQHDLTNSYKASKLVGTLVDEHVSSTRNPDGSHNVTLQLFLDERTFSAVAGFNFKNPATLRDLQAQPSGLAAPTEAERARQEIARKVMAWLATKKMVHDENILAGSDQLSAVPLRSYCSSQWVKMHQAKDQRQVAVALVGDSAMGVPFFRSLNNGLKEGVWLSNILSQITPSEQGHLVGLLPSFSGYTRRMTLLSMREFLVAKIKSLAIKLFQLFIAVSAKVFWQVLYWTRLKRQFVDQASRRPLEELIAAPVPADQLSHYSSWKRPVSPVAGMSAVAASA